MSVRVDWLHLIEPSNVTGTWLNLVMSVRVDWLQNVPFLRKSVQTHNPMHYLASNKIDLDYRVCGRLFLDLFHNTLSGAWNAKKERKKEDVWTERKFNHDNVSRFWCYRFSTLVYYDSYLCNDAFFDYIEWVTVFCWDFIHVVSFCNSAISRFWICWCWRFMILDETTFSCLRGTILVPVEIELVRTCAYICMNI